MPKKPKTPQKPDKDIRDEPGYWFVKFERAVEDGDYEVAAEAKRNLKRLGALDRLEEVTI